MQKKNVVKSTWQFLRNFFALLKPYKRSLLWALVWTAAMQILALAEPSLMMFIIDDVFKHGVAARPRILPLCLAGVGLLLLTTLIRVFKDRAARVSGTNVYHDLPVLCGEKILRLPLVWHQQEHSGETVSSVNRGVIKVQELVFIMLFDVVPVLIQVCVAVIALATVHWAVLAILAPVVAIFFILLVWVKRKWHENRMTRHELGREADRLLFQAIDRVMTTQSFSQADRELAEVRAKHNEDRDRFFREAAYADRTNFISNGMVSVARVGVIAVCAYLIFGGTLSVGQIVFASMLSERLFMSCYQMGRIYDRVTDAIEPVTVLTELLAEKETVTDPVEPKASPVPPLRIELRDVTYHYASSPEENALAGVDLTIEHGTMVGIVGGSGHGKSTLGKLLLRFDDPTTGRILMNGTDIRDIRKQDLRRLIGYVPQEAELYDRTIRDNIRYGCPDADEAAVVEAATLAHADEFIRKLPNGYDAMIGTRGQYLSGGQRQRISIARAVIMNPAVLIFDEATNSVDAETIAEIKRAMTELRRNRTFIVITHQISTIQDADMIVVMKDGAIYGKPGKHADLIKHNDVYRGFVRHQQNLDAALYATSSSGKNLS